MKKLYLILTILLVSATFIFGQTITVTSPAAGDEWITGSSHNITWIKTGRMNDDVKIRVYNAAGAKVLDIVDNTDNDGSYEGWRVPGSLPEGTYTIRVKTIDNRVTGDSGAFRISGPTPAIDPVIEVTSPRSSSRWGSPSTKTITWRHPGTMDPNVRILLRDETGGSSRGTIIGSTPNDGSFEWPILAGLEPGRYMVRITTIDGLVTDDSSPFEIFRVPTATLPENNVLESRRVIPGNTQPVISVVYPNGGEVLMRGGRCEIRWECVDGFNPPRIKIQKGGRTVKEYPPSRIFSLRTRAGYSWTWMIPGDLAPGSDYKVRIEKGDFSRSRDLSDSNFTISSSSNIEVTEPRGGGLVATNGTFIRWRAGGVEGNVNVHLQRADGAGGLQLIRSNVPVTPSSFLWHVGALPGGGTIFDRERYKVIVTAADGSASGESNSFQIVKPTLEVISPGSSGKRRGDTLNIQWNNSRGFHGNVDVILEKQTGSTWVVYDTLFTNTHDKTLSWRIPPRAGFGEADLDPFPTDVRYRIYIKSVRCPRLIFARGPWFMVR